MNGYLSLLQNLNEQELLDHFATHIAQGLVSIRDRSAYGPYFKPAMLASRSYEYAEAMLAERNRRIKEKQEVLTTEVEEAKQRFDKAWREEAEAIENKYRTPEPDPKL
jgi:hypothetical protein